MSDTPSTVSQASSLSAFAPEALVRVKERAPLVQCLTNAVVTGFTANVLLAVGASPAMVDIPGEAGMFARIASGLLVNLGTPHAEQRAAMLEAARAAADEGTPWVLDPVAVGQLPVRTALARELLDLRPTLIRGNASEIIALAGVGAGGRGVDASDTVEAAEETAGELARTHGAVVAVSGPVDFVTDGGRSARIANGDALLTQVTGGGCALGAVLAAFAAVDDDRFATTVAGIAAYTVAAEQAAKNASGPGSFAVAFLDALASLPASELAERAVIA